MRGERVQLDTKRNRSSHDPQQAKARQEKKQREEDARSLIQRNEEEARRSMQLKRSREEAARALIQRNENEARRSLQLKRSREEAAFNLALEEKRARHANGVNISFA